MFSLNKKRGFTLAEVLVTLGLVGAISALVLPTLVYNYKGKVLEQQYRDTYSEIRQIGSMINYEKGDVGEYANKLRMSEWEKDFVARLSGGNKLLTSPTPAKIKQALQNHYKAAGTNPGPYYFNLSDKGQKVEVGDKSTNYLCDNSNIWVDNKGRIWTFNNENRIICVDINGTANPNRYNIDIFSFTPMSAEMVARWVYNDPDNPGNYSGAIFPCDIEQQHRKSLGNIWPCKTYPDKKCSSGDGEHTNDVAFEKGSGSALDYCPFNEPIENIAAVNSYLKGKSAKRRNITTNNTYWKDYIDYK